LFHEFSGHQPLQYHAGDSATPFVVSEEKRFVRHQPSTRADPELVEGKPGRSCRRPEKLTSLQRTIAMELVQNSVKTVRPSLADDVDARGSMAV
jgi:hypothetical protein